MTAVRLVALGAPVVDALARGDLAAAAALSPLALPPSFGAPGNGSLWRMRAAQLAADPTVGGWLTGAILDAATEAVVGRAGFHGPPDEGGMVEVGYEVDPAYRRRGYARAALEDLLARAAAEPAVSTVRACVRPDNTPSLSLLAGYGFTAVGEQWDAEDGLETVFEVPASVLSRS